MQTLRDYATMTVSVAIKVAGLAAIAILLSAGSCNRAANFAPEGIKKFYCGEPVGTGAYKPVGWSKSDTDETIRQTKNNNAVFVGTCGRPK